MIVKLQLSLIARLEGGVHDLGRRLLGDAGVGGVGVEAGVGAGVGERPVDRAVLEAVTGALDVVYRKLACDRTYVSI